MKQDIRTVKSIEDWIRYFSDNLGWYIDFDEIDDIDDITYQYTAEDLGLKPESFAKVKSLKQMAPLTNDQPWGVFCVEFEGKRFEVTALRRILSTLIPRKRRYITDRKTWNLNDLLFICSWGEGNETTLGLAHFEEREGVLPQLKVIYCAPAKEDTHNIRTFEERISHLEWPANPSDTERWRGSWSAAFTSGYRETIHFAAELTLKLAEEARAIRDRILHTLEIETEQGYVHGLYSKFKEQLLHDMKEQDFADMYAQTIVYGLFSARCMDDTPETFSAAEAVSHIPNTNPFLKSLLQECLDVKTRSGISFDELEVGNVVDILSRINPKKIVEDFGRQTGGGREDPVLHFYEEFLNAYDKTQKVQRGVYYTPQPVVNFIVRAVDDILKNEFGLKDGLASTETKLVEMPVEKAQKGASGLKTVMEKVEVPAVQVLDPATGTGTFLRQVILTIYENFKAAHKGKPAEAVQKAWNEYVPEHLLPRINGFELMMAPYAVAHMKLAMVLQETGYDFHSDKRLQVYLTNTLEEPGSSGSQMMLFSDPLAMESVEANKAKNNHGINIVLGNPPYSSSSTNRSQWIQTLNSVYKQDLKERKINLDDDYIKFIRYGEYIVESTNLGILAYISNNSFLDGITHRAMRKHLMDSFNEIFIINLHGNVKKKEQAENGGKDENVFDIQQGVSINIFIRNNNKNKKCKVFSLDLQGLRDYKYKSLNEITLRNGFVVIKPEFPNYFFVPKDFSLQNEYEEAIQIEQLFPLYNSGIQTKCDNIAVSYNRDTLENNLEYFKCHSPVEIENHFNRKSNSGWSAEKAKLDIVTNTNIRILPYLYRPFDIRYIIYSNVSSGIIGRPRSSVMDHMCYRNISLITVHFQTTFPFQHALVTNHLSDLNSISMQTGEQSFVFPLYKYQEEFGALKRIPNIDYQLAEKLLTKTGLSIHQRSATEEDIFAYAYAILYSSKYRKKYREFLKIAFPRIPIPNSKKQFFDLVSLGQQLIRVHITEEDLETNSKIINSVIVDKNIKQFIFSDKRIYINKSSYIDNITPEEWNFYIGGYQPLQKWLKDRKGMTLSEEDITHYKQMITVIRRTIEIMDEIDAVIEL